MVDGAEVITTSAKYLNEEPDLEDIKLIREPDSAVVSPPPLTFSAEPPAITAVKGGFDSQPD